MSSIIQEYNYDIFVSYRQKDNKGYRWVSEFVEALKTELESTFKEEISVYFDINPHDGLLETHDVDASLKDKLKCLVFIPIISRTYCDPKSFAWEHEFKAFVEQASQDQFGLKIKLPDGNVANRVLPIRIHDLDKEDIKLCESVLGGVLRGIEFIYKEPGANKPLTTDDDEKKNLNNTKYKIQINKIALALKEIITGIEGYIQQQEEVSKEVFKPISINKKSKKTGIIVITVTVLALIILGIFLVPKLINPSKPDEKSIAVLPFINDSPDQENAYFINGIMDEILNNLQKIKDFRVLSRTSTEQYRGSNKPLIPKIAKELGVNYIVEGSGQKYGNTFRLRVQLISANNEKHLWGESYEQEIQSTKDIFRIQSQVAQAIASKLETTITPLEKQLIEKLPTQNLTAYDTFLKGQYCLFKLNDVDSAMKYFELAKEIDPKYALAYAGISYVWQSRLQFGSASIAEGGIKSLESIIKALELDSTSAEVQYSYGYVIVSTLWDWKKGETAYKKAIELNPNSAIAHSWYSTILTSLGRNEEALKQCKIAIKLDPKNSNINTTYAFALFYNRQYDDALKIIAEVLKVDKNYPSALFIRPYILHMAGKYEDALEAFKVFYADNYLKDYDHAFNIGISKGGYANALRMEADTLYSQVNKIKVQHFLYSDLVMLYTAGGDREKALTFLEVAYKEHDPLMSLLLLPIFDSLREDPRFQDLCRRMKLPYK